MAAAARCSQRQSSSGVKQQQRLWGAIIIWQGPASGESPTSTDYVLASGPGAAEAVGRVGEAVGVVGLAERGSGFVVCSSFVHCPLSSRVVQLCPVDGARPERSDAVNMMVNMMGNQDSAASCHTALNHVRAVRRNPDQ